MHSSPQGSRAPTSQPRSTIYSRAATNKLFSSGEEGVDIIVFHAYDAHAGRPALQVSTLTWSGGWPHAAFGD